MSNSNDARGSQPAAVLERSSDDLFAPFPPHLEISDEKALTVLDDIQDDAADEPTADVNFSITSYGADYPVDVLVKRMSGESFFIPPFQRSFVWSQRHASRFIESLLMGLPVPGIFLYKETDTGRHLVVDGQQRLRSLQYFYSGLFNDNAFRLLNVRSEWEGKTYRDLGSSDQLKLDDSIVHATIFQQDEPKNTQKSLYFVFERINSGGIRLSAQEIRNCISQSPVLKVVSELNDVPSWRNIFGQRKNKRLKDQELILRALAMMANGENYSAPMRDFLNDFCSESQNTLPLRGLNALAQDFVETIDLINEAKGRQAFRPIRALNAAVLEAVVVGLRNRLDEQPDGVNPLTVAAAYDRLMTDRDFMQVCESATATEASVRRRQRIATDYFMSI